MSQIDAYQIVATDYDAVSYEIQDSYDPSVEFADQWARFVSKLKPTASILNVGGNLTECQHFCDLGFNVTDIDISPNTLKHISASDSRITTIQANIIDFNGNTYDGIWACRSLIHIPPDDLVSAIQNMQNLIENDGIISMIFFTTTAKPHLEQIGKDPFSQQNTLYCRTLYQEDYLKNLITPISHITAFESCADKDNEPAVYIEISKH